MKKLIVIVLIASIFGCASGVQLLRRVEPGMSPSQVDEIMGRRDSFRSAEYDGSNYTLYEYHNRYCNAHRSLYDKCDFYVIFEDDRVVETGVREVRSQMPNMHYLHVFQH